MNDGMSEAAERGREHLAAEDGTVFEDDDDSQIRDLGRAEPVETESEDGVQDEVPGSLSDGGARSGVEIVARLLDLMDLDGDVVFERTPTSAVLNIEGDDLGVLIGRRGLTLAALQYVVRLMIASREGEARRDREFAATSGGDTLPCRNWRARWLIRRGTEASHHAGADAPDERRVVHLALTGHPESTRRAVGEDLERKVVIHPKRT
jgi:spoIIIJ-associated protein